MKGVIIVFYLLLLLFASIYLFDRYYITKVTAEDPIPSWYDEAARRYGAEYIASLLEGEE